MLREYLNPLACSCDGRLVVVTGDIRVYRSLEEIIVTLRDISEKQQAWTPLYDSIRDIYGYIKKNQHIITC